MRKVFIYGFVCPFSGEIRYVGKTVDLPQRMRMHYGAAEMATDTKKVRWLKKVLSHGFFPEVKILEEANEINWAEREAWWIMYLTSEGFKLTNTTRGGQGTTGRVQKAETRAKISASKIGKKRTEEQKAGMKISQKLRWQNASPEDRQKAVSEFQRNADKERSRIIKERLSGIFKSTNRRKQKSKLLGVFWRNGRWYSALKVNAKLKELGYFQTEELAHEAYKKAALENLKSQWTPS